MNRCRPWPGFACSLYHHAPSINSPSKDRSRERPSRESCTKPAIEPPRVGERGTQQTVSVPYLSSSLSLVVDNRRVRLFLLYTPAACSRRGDIARHSLVDEGVDLGDSCTKNQGSSPLSVHSCDSAASRASSCIFRLSHGVRARRPDDDKGARLDFLLVPTGSAAAVCCTTTAPRSLCCEYHSAASCLTPRLSTSTASAISLRRYQPALLEKSSSYYDLRQPDFGGSAFRRTTSPNANAVCLLSS